MTDQTETSSPEYWRSKASETRRIADGLTTEANRLQLLALAENYERLADQAERS